VCIITQLILTEAKVNKQTNKNFERGSWRKMEHTFHAQHTLSVTYDFPDNLNNGIFMVCHLIPQKALQQFPSYFVFEVPA